MQKLPDIVYVLLFGFYSALKHVWIQALVLAGMFLAGMVIFAHYQQLDWLSALVASASTITTIGIYAPNIVTMPNSEKGLLIIIFVLSVGSAASLIQGFVTSALKKEFFMEEMGELKARRMKDHVIVMGYAFLGKYVTEKLSKLGVAFVVVSKDEAQVQTLRAKGVTAIAASRTQSFEALQKAGVERARAVIATFDDDGDNMLAVMSAKRLNPSVKAITVLNDTNLHEGAKAAQADVVISPSDMVSEMLSLSALSREIAGVIVSERLGARNIEEFAIRKSGLMLSRLESVSPVLLVLRKDRVLSGISRDMALEPGDVVYVLADHDLLRQFGDIIEG